MHYNYPEYLLHLEPQPEREFQMWHQNLHCPHVLTMLLALSVTSSALEWHNVTLFSRESAESQQSLNKI